MFHQQPPALPSGPPYRFFVHQEGPFPWETWPLPGSLGSCPRDVPGHWSSVTHGYAAAGVPRRALTVLMAGHSMCYLLPGTIPKGSWDVATLGRGKQSWPGMRGVQVVLSPPTQQQTGKVIPPSMSTQRGWEPPSHWSRLALTSELPHQPDEPHGSPTQTTQPVLAPHLIGMDTCHVAARGAGPGQDSQRVPGHHAG